MTSFARCALSASALIALLTGCANSQPPSGAGDASGAPQQRLARTNPSGTQLLYVINGRNLLVFSFPDGTLVARQNDIGSLRGACSDKDGNVFTVLLNGATDKILEFAHGGITPIATLMVPGRADGGCAVDPKTNDLAVTFNNSTTASVALFTGESGTPQIYSTEAFGTFFECAFDTKSNLFISNYGTRTNAVPLVELRGGSHTFAGISVNQDLKLGGGLQWHDGYLAAGENNGYGHAIYHVKIVGGRGRVVGTTALGDSTWGETWIVDGIVAAATRSWSGGGVSLFAYPSGNFIQKLRRNDFQRRADVFGLTVSASSS
jgi:hypothetical protein